MRRTFMRKQLALITLALLLATDIRSSEAACDPNEKCSGCLVSVFGKCKVRGNDPACEVRKKACRIPVVGPIVTAPGTPLGPGGVAGPGGPGVGPLSQDDIKFCFADPGRCPARVVSTVTYQQLSLIVDSYIADLRHQAENKWQRLRPEFISGVQKFYPEVDLRSVKYATGINTRHGLAITIGYDIFFPGQLQLDTRDEVQLMLHELEHVVQYRRRGGERQFLSEYIAKGAGKVIEKRRLDIHDEHDIERAAISKAERVVNAYYGWNFLVRNPCSVPIMFALNYLDTDHGWIAVGFWKFEPHQNAYLEDEEGRRPRSKSTIYYVYGETEDGKHTWAGDLLKPINWPDWPGPNDRDLPFQKVQGSPTSTHAFEFTCP